MITKRKNKMKVTSMNAFIKNHIERTPLDRLVIELEEILSFKLTDDTIIESTELRTYYFSRMQHIISHIGKMIELDNKKGTK
jgi:hypothetical protein